MFVSVDKNYSMKNSILQVLCYIITYLIIKLKLMISAPYESILSENIHLGHATEKPDKFPNKVLN